MPKQAARELIEQLPERVTWDDLMYELYVKQKIEGGLEKLDEAVASPTRKSRAVCSAVTLRWMKTEWSPPFSTRAETGKRAPGKRMVDGPSFRLAEEIGYITRHAAEHDGRVVTIGQLTLFSTAG
jgi:hypothetical protein